MSWPYLHLRQSASGHRSVWSVPFAIVKAHEPLNPWSLSPLSSWAKPWMDFLSGWQSLQKPYRTLFALFATLGVGQAEEEAWPVCTPCMPHEWRHVGFTCWGIGGNCSVRAGCGTWRSASVCFHLLLTRVQSFCHYANKLATYRTAGHTEGGCCLSPNIMCSSYSTASCSH